MPSYTPGGKAHRILALLEEGPATFSDLVHVLGVSPRRAAKAKAWSIAEALQADRLIHRGGGAYHLTSAGAAKLAELRAAVDGVRRAA